MGPITFQLSFVIVLNVVFHIVVAMVTVICSVWWGFDASAFCHVTGMSDGDTGADPAYQPKSNSFDGLHFHIKSGRKHSMTAVLDTSH